MSDSANHLCHEKGQSQLESSLHQAIVNHFLDAADDWYESHRKQNGDVNTNTLTTGLVVSRMIRDGLPITSDRLRSKNNSQVRGMSGKSVAGILADHGEHRLFTREGGRTSRGTLPKAQEFAARINSVSRVNLISTNPAEVASALEAFFTEKTRRDFFDKQRIKVDIDPQKPVSQVIHDILSASSERSDKPTGVILQHLVGAKLELRFPDIEIGRDQASAADVQTNREGDFQVGTTAFHVTVAPMEKLMDRCRDNLRHGLRPVVLVPAGRVSAASQITEIAGLFDRVSVVEGESFIGTNIEEIAQYDTDKIKEGLARLIRRYNERIEAVEVDQSLRIDEPSWIEKLATDNDF